jgi:hypothetical protein
MSYIKRIAEEDLLEKLSASGAVLIKGPNRVEKQKQLNNMQKAF